ncbi:hypothetical protein [Lewinella sp. 4G2]|uniref:hypothetical protein n=1 Tax=Lewinella sp. 4G2 TaxID=1803372 RepID=UPI0007B4B5ED|nr:hypothetical protein [Lewinella sp. 4G2]OAV45676.1 hypothetical protein A3850_014775 [Lewinella sp. 4G2]
MIEDIFNAVKGGLGDLAGSVTDGAREKSLALIEDWLEIFPQLGEYGLEITSFSMGLALSPSLNVELLGKHEDWDDEAITERIKQHKGETSITMVLSTIRTAYRLQRKTKAPLRDPLILKIIVKVPPEVRVVLGQPVLED